MKFFHTADWHLGKIVQGIHMTDDQSYVLEQFIQAIIDEQPDAVVVAGDIYDRAVPPTEAVHLLDDVFKRIIVDLNVPILAVAGNHDSPGRIDFASSILKGKGLHLVGRMQQDLSPVVLNDDYGDVHFHLIPYADPSTVRHVLEDDTIKTHDDATKAIIQKINDEKDEQARHVFVGHLFATPYGEPEENESDSERPLSIGGAEYVNAHHFKSFDYTALGHLHRGHYVLDETIRYSGSLLKYSLSEEHHKKGFNIVKLDKAGNVTVEKRLLTPMRDIRTVEGTIEDIQSHDVNEDYVFVQLLNKEPIISPMEKVRTTYPNAMHVMKKSVQQLDQENRETSHQERSELNDFQLFQAFYKEIKGEEPSEEVEQIFKETLDESERERTES